MTQKDINKENLMDHTGSMNIIMQISGHVDNGTIDGEAPEKWQVNADQYQPKWNRVWSGGVLR